MSSLVAPVAAVGLDQVAREDFSGLEVDHGDLVLVDDGEDAPAGMGGADPEVMQAAGPAQCDLTTPVDEVVAEPEVARGAAPGRVGLRSHLVGLGRGHAPDGPVWPLFVVDEPEGIELCL